MSVCVCWEGGGGSVHVCVCMGGTVTAKLITILEMLTSPPHGLFGE